MEQHLVLLRRLAELAGERGVQVDHAPGLSGQSGHLQPQARVRVDSQDDLVRLCPGRLGEEGQPGGSAQEQAHVGDLVRNLRFANVALAELWNRKSVSCAQITMAEDFGVEGRGRFYDSVGSLRDVVQNHLLHVLALVVMDPPVGASAGDTKDKKAEVFRAIRPTDPQHCVRGAHDEQDRLSELLGTDPAARPVGWALRGELISHLDRLRTELEAGKRTAGPAAAQPYLAVAARGPAATAALVAPADQVTG